MKNSKIGWTDHTFNPWWGCSRVSPGCRFCYAETFAKRVGQAVWGDDAPRRFFGDGHWAEPLKWDRAAAAAGRPALVFCASMADVFEDRADLVLERTRLFEVIVSTPHLRWLLLTKRPENVLGMVPEGWRRAEPPTAGDLRSARISARAGIDTYTAWPWNAWIGTTVEDQQRANERIPELLEIPAPVRFLSCEPLLGPVDLSRWAPDWDADDEEDLCQLHGLPGCEQLPACRGIEWIIAGGESGGHRRPFDVDHARALERFAHDYGIPFFFKQHGGLHPDSGGHLLDGRLRWAWPAAAGDRTDLADSERARLGLNADRS